MDDKYKDIIDKPYKKSTKRPQMSIADRAAQFGSFAALTGHKEAIKETARLTENRITIDECQIRNINENLRLLELSLDVSKKWSECRTAHNVEDKNCKNCHETNCNYICAQNDYESEEYNLIKKIIEKKHNIRVVYFVPDIYKSGGKYIEIIGKVCKVDRYKRQLILHEGGTIPIDDIIEIEI